MMTNSSLRNRYGQQFYIRATSSYHYATATSNSCTSERYPAIIMQQLWATVVHLSDIQLRHKVLRYAPVSEQINMCLSLKTATENVGNQHGHKAANTPSRNAF